MMGPLGMWGVGLGALAFILVVVIGVAVLAVVLARQKRVQPDDPRPDGGAIELLRRRYAAGEIDDEEFQRRLAALGTR